MTAWCHLDSNSCTENDISACYINNTTLASLFKTSFNMTNGYYWSSSPGEGEVEAGGLVFYISNSRVGPDEVDFRRFDYRVRCLKDSISA